MAVHQPDPAPSTLTRYQERTMTTEETLAKHAELDLIFKQQQIEDLQRRNQDAADAKEARRMKLRKQEADLAENERQRLIREANCTHKKGGRNRAGLDRGNDSSNYAVITNTYPAGDVDVSCQRCGKRWVNPPAALRESNPAQYEKLLADYRRALELPTDNTPSGAQLFVITKPPVIRDEATPRTAAPRAPKQPKKKAA
jgi:hypothetical protein